jgi:hypothetical protein
MWMMAELVRMGHDLGLVVEWEGGSMGKVVDLMTIKDKDEEKMVRIIYDKFCDSPAIYQESRVCYPPLG